MEHFITYKGENPLDTLDGVSCVIGFLTTAMMVNEGDLSQKDAQGMAHILSWTDKLIATASDKWKPSV